MHVSVFPVFSRLPWFVRQFAPEEGGIVRVDEFSTKASLREMPDGKVEYRCEYFEIPKVCAARINPNLSRLRL